MNSHRFHPTVLREYDIRGIVGDTIRAEDALALGRAFGTVVIREGGGKKTVCIGYDGRLHSPKLEAALVRGLTETGVDVIRVGLGPTPLLYYSVFHYEAGGGVMITGSHNPSDQNGFKLMLGKRAFFGADITRLGPIAAQGDFAQGRGTVRQAQPFEDYLKELVKGYAVGKSAPRRELSVAWDPGNGAAGDVVTALIPKLPGRHVVINAKIDGTFPAHHPDPAEEHNLVQLQEAVKANRCDLGIAFDGDGDRIGIIDGRGKVLWADMLLALMAREVLRELPGSTIIADVKSSQVLYDEIARLGGKPLMWRTGHALIKAKLFEIKAPLAGELSGHLFFADHYYGFDDAIYAAVRFLGMLARNDQTLAQLVSSLPQLPNTPEMRIFCSEERKFTIVEELRDRMRVAGANVIDVDGVRVKTEDGWWLVRASNTQAALVARAEGKDEKALARVRATLEKQLELSGVKVPA